MTRDEKITAAVTLRSEGLTQKAIALHLGVSQGTVAKWLNPEKAKEWRRRDNENRREAKREWERIHYRGKCKCGAMTSHPKKNRCNACRLKDDADRVTARRREIERRWNAGESLKQIAAAMGTTYQVIGVEITRMRNEGGWNVPLRHGGKYAERRAAA